jgi:hypothetical protein
MKDAPINLLPLPVPDVVDPGRYGVSWRQASMQAYALDNVAADRAAASAEPPQAIGWMCGCGHPNGINLANCAGCGRPPHDDPDWGPNSVGYIYPAAAPSPAEPKPEGER